MRRLFLAPLILLVLGVGYLSIGTARAEDDRLVAVRPTGVAPLPAANAAEKQSRD